MMTEREKKVAQIIRDVPHWEEGAEDDNNRMDQVMSRMREDKLIFKGCPHLVNALFPVGESLRPADGSRVQTQRIGSLDKRFASGMGVTVRKAETGGWYLITQEHGEDGIWIQAAQRLLVAPSMGEGLVVVDVYSAPMPLYPVVGGELTSNGLATVVDLECRIIDGALTEDFIVWGHLDAPSFLKLGEKAAG